MNSMYPKKSAARETPAAKPSTAAAKRRGPRIQVRRSGIHGKGVFALAPIPKGERILEYTGSVITWKQAKKLPPHNPDDPNHTFFFHIDDKHVINGLDGGNAAKWINHACGPNCEADERRRPRLHHRAARHRAGRGAQLRLRADPRRQAHQEGEEGVRVPLRDAQVPGHDAPQRRSERVLADPVIEHVVETGSTNSDLLARVHAAAASRRRDLRAAPAGRRAADAPAAAATAGAWHGAAGASLTFSLAWPFTRADLSGLSLAVGVALADALEPPPGAGADRPEVAERPLAARRGAGPAQRPGSKLAGVLVETAPFASGRVAVIGVGINVLPLDVADAARRRRAGRDRSVGDRGGDAGARSRRR